MKKSKVREKLKVLLTNMKARKSMKEKHAKK